MLHLGSCPQSKNWDQCGTHLCASLLLKILLLYIACYPVPKSSCCTCFVQFYSCLWQEGKSGTNYSVKEIEVSYSFGTYTICFLTDLQVTCTISFWFINFLSILNSAIILGDFSVWASSPSNMLVYLEVTPVRSPTWTTLWWPWLSPESVLPVKS